MMALRQRACGGEDPKGVCVASIFSLIPSTYRCCQKDGSPQR